MMCTLSMEKFNRWLVAQLIRLRRGELFNIRFVTIIQSKNIPQMYSETLSSIQHYNESEYTFSNGNQRIRYIIALSLSMHMLLNSVSNVSVTRRSLQLERYTCGEVQRKKPHQQLVAYNRPILPSQPIPELQSS